MPFLPYKNWRIHYKLTEGLDDSPVVVFINGLTQSTSIWTSQTNYLKDKGIRTLTFDLLGQGESSKPVLDLNFEENADVLKSLLEQLKIEKAYIAGISFGGIIVLKFGIRFPWMVKGLIPMSCFSEMDNRLWRIGVIMFEGMTKIGLNYLLDSLVPINLSSEWLEKNEKILPTLRKTSLSKNDLYAIQNLMESLQDFKPFTEELVKIQAPTLILNAEFDYLTPRWCHEKIRQKISNSKLVLIQNSFHAFTIEKPEITNKLIEDFVKEVERGEWKGNREVLIAEEDINANPFLLECQGDHTRAIPIFKKKKS